MVTPKAEAHVPPVVCVAEKDVPAGTVVPPEVRPLPCSGCGVRVLASPPSRELIRRGIARPVCFVCGEAWAAARSVFGVLSSTAAALLDDPPAEGASPTPGGGA